MRRSSVTSSARCVERDTSVDEHDEAVGDIDELAQLVADHDHCRALRGRRPQVLDQPVGFVRRQTRSHFIGDDERRTARQQARDCDQRPLAERQRIDQRMRVQAVEADGPKATLRLRGLASHVQELGAGMLAEEEVLRHRQGVDETEVLVHHAEDGVERPSVRCRDRAAVGLVDAIEDLDQRRLASPVGAEQRDELARLEGQRDVRKDGVLPEPLGHPSELDSTTVPEGGLRRSVCAGAQLGCQERPQSSRNIARKSSAGSMYGLPSG